MSDSGFAPDAPPVVVTKVRPPRRRRDHLSRQRLLDYVSDNIDRKLLLLSAPPGYGKTSLLVDFVEAAAFPVCWYRLDPSDVDPAVFFAHLLAALRQRYPDAAGRTGAALLATGRLDIDAVVGLLVNEMDEQIDEFFWLVLDDYHHVDASLAVNRAVDRLLHYLPGNCQLVVASRTLPTKLTLTRLAGEGQVAGIGQEQLRFTPTEIRALVELQHGMQLSEMESERLAQESEGWITALVLGSVRLLDGVRVGLSHASADRAQLFDFLAREVYEAQPEPVRTFLSESALCDALSPELCRAVLERDDAPAMLSWLDEHNLFVTPVAGDGTWYRYHQLFQEFLRTAVPPTPERTVALERRAAAWYAAADRPDLAIEHLLAAGDHAAAADQMASAVPGAHAHGRWQTIIRWARALPPEVLADRPELLRRIGTAYTYDGNMADAIAAFGTAVAHYEASGDTENLAAVLVTRALAWRMLDQIGDAIADSRRALELVDDPDSPVAGMAYRSLGGALILRGEMAGAATELQRALACFERHGLAASVALVHTDLSAMYQMSGDIERAIGHALAARDRWERLGNEGSLALTLNNLGTAYHQQGRFEDARQRLDEAVAHARQAGVPRTEARALVSMGDVLSDLDDFTGALDHYTRGLAIARVVDDHDLLSYGLAASVEAERLAGRPGEARALLVEAREALAAHLTAYEAALVDYVRGTLALDLREFDRAAEHLEDAAAAFARLGARREEARAMLYRCAVAQHAGLAADAAAWRERAEAAMRSFGHAASFAPYLRRLPEVFPSAGRATEGRAALRRAPAVVAARAEPPTAARLRVLALGRPEILVDGRPVDRKAWQTLIARDLFLWLVDRPGGIGRDELMVAFWPESPEIRARSSLHSTLYRVRRALADKELVLTDFERYFVRRSDDLYYDVAEFETLVEQAGRAADDAERAAALDRAAALVRGPYVDGVAGEWCGDRRLQLDLGVPDALLALAEADERLGRVTEAVAVFQRVLQWDELREEAHCGLMRTYAASGARAQALRQFEQYERRLAAALGASPGAEAIGLYRTIRGDAESRAG